MNTSVIPEIDEKWVTDTLKRVAEDLALIIDHPFFVHGIALERAERRPAADGGVHISFKLALQRGQTIVHGAVLIPLAQALLLAAWLHMMPDEEARRRASETHIDQSMKDGLLEIGNFVAGAAE